MADEAQVSTTEEIVGQVEEGTVASLEVETNDAPDVVPARDLMALKDKNEKLKAQLKEEREARKALEESKNAEPDDTLSKFSDVDPDFIKGITEKAKKEALKEMEEKLAQHSQKEQFNKKLDETVDKQIEIARQNGVKIPNSVDKTLLKALALANPKEPISSLAERLYWIDERGKATTENDTRPAMDYITETVDVDNLSKEQLAKVFADPKARKAYFDKKYK